MIQTVRFIYKNKNNGVNNEIKEQQLRKKKQNNLNKITIIIIR